MPEMLQLHVVDRYHVGDNQQCYEYDNVAHALIRSFLIGVFSFYIEKILLDFPIPGELVLKLLDAAIQYIDCSVNLPRVAWLKASHKNAHFVHEREHVVHPFLAGF
mgnify:CR=1 FL=1